MFSKFYNLISKMPAYIRRFGIHGIRLVLQIEGLGHRPQKSKKYNKYYLPGVDVPIYLRNCVSDHAIFWQCLVKNQYDFHNYPQAERLVEEYKRLISSGEAPVIIDCGGNIGLSTVWYASNFPLAKVYVIEPDQFNLEILQRNVSCFGDRVVILKGGIWSQAGFLKIVNPESGPAAYRVKFSEEEEVNSIPCYTINEICVKEKISHPLIVKMDIEGAQKEVFSCNTEWVQQTNLITLELDDWLLPWQRTSESFFSCLSQYSFDYLLNGESIFCFRNFHN